MSRRNVLYALRHFHEEEEFPGWLFFNISVGFIATLASCLLFQIVLLIVSFNALFLYFGMLDEAAEINSVIQAPNRWVYQMLFQFSFGPSTGRIQWYFSVVLGLLTVVGLTFKDFVRYVLRKPIGFQLE